MPLDRPFKVVLVGNSSVGKTSLLRRFCDDLFYPGTAATVGQYTHTHTHLHISNHTRADTQTTPGTALWPSSQPLPAKLHTQQCEKLITADLRQGWRPRRLDILGLHGW